MLGSVRKTRGFPAAPGFLQLATAAAVLGVAACDTPSDPSLALVLSQYAVEFRAVRGSSTLVTQSIEISNAGGGRLGPVSCPAQPAPWLACAVSGGNVVMLTANPAGLAQSPAQATLELTAPGISSPAQVLVDFRIDQPVVTLSAGTVTLSANEGSNTTTPAQGNITVTNTGAGTLANLAPLSCAPTPANARVTCSVNQSNGALTVQVDPAGLAPGTYVYPVSVISPNTSAPATFAVALTVAALPRIALSTRSLHFQAVRGSGLTAGQNITVSNSGGGTLGALTCSTPVTWLTCSVLGSTVTLAANATGLTASPLPATVSISAVGAANNPQTVSVTFQIEQPQVAVSPQAVTFVATEGGAVVEPESHSVTVANVGAGTFANLGNITCTPPSGSPVVCNVVGTQVVLTIDNANLVAGVTTYPVSVAAQNSSVAATLSVTVNSEPPPRVGVAQNTVHFTAIRGSVTPSTQTVGVLNLGGGQLGVVSCTSPAAWLTCTADELGIHLTANPTGLTSSPSPAVVQVSAQSAAGISQGSATINVSMSLEQPVLAVTPTSAQIQGSGVVNVTASNIGAGTLANLGAIGCPSPPAGITCGTVNPTTGAFTITVSGSTAAGIHVVNVTAANAGNAQTVTIVVTAP